MLGMAPVAGRTRHLPAIVDRTRGLPGNAEGAAFKVFRRGRLRVFGDSPN